MPGGAGRSIAAEAVLIRDDAVGARHDARDRVGADGPAVRAVGCKRAVGLARLVWDSLTCGAVGERDQVDGRQRHADAGAGTLEDAARERRSAKVADDVVQDVGPLVARVVEVNVVVDLVVVVVAQPLQAEGGEDDLAPVPAVHGVCVVRVPEHGGAAVDAEVRRGAVLGRDRADP